MWDAALRIDTIFEVSYIKALFIKLEILGNLIGEIFTILNCYEAIYENTFDYKNIKTKR